jgi:glucose/arabinose dehydrogenase
VGGRSLTGQRRGAVTAVVAAFFIIAPSALGTSPGLPRITEPDGEGTLVNASDVHMEAYDFNDPDGNSHVCSEWEIYSVALGETAWHSVPTCEDDVRRNHVHLGDGFFINGHTGRIELLFNSPYILRVRFKDSAGEYSPWAERSFRTYPLPPPGTAASNPWVPRQPGFAVDVVAGGFQLPDTVAMVPNPGSGPKSPLLYVGELYGGVKTVTRDGSVRNYRSGLLNFDPVGDFPGSGEFGLGGLTVQPGTGDVFASHVYETTPGSGTFYGRVIRMHSGDGGYSGGPPQTVLDLGTDLPPEQQAPSHQISNLSFGPDGNLYLHQADGFQPDKATNIDSYLGKVLRFDTNGDAVGYPIGNPHFSPGDGITTRDYVWARGFRNPFGGAWRTDNNAHYVVENGPMVDRLSRLDFPQPDGGLSWGWNGSDASMATRALYNWGPPAHAPVSIAFAQKSAFGGSGFPASKMDHAFVTESGPTYATGPQPTGKRIVEFSPKPGGDLAGPPSTLVEYTGVGRATAAGLAAGPDGLYFTDLYKDTDYTSPADAGGRLLRIRYFPPSRSCTIDGRTLEVSLSKPSRTKKGKRRSRATVRRRGDELVVNGHWCGATVDNVDSVRVTGARGGQVLTLDLRGGPLGPGATAEDQGDPDLEVSVRLKAGKDLLRIVRKKNSRVRMHRKGGSLNGDRDKDVFASGVERVQVVKR